MTRVITRYVALLAALFLYSNGHSAFVSAAASGASNKVPTASVSVPLQKQLHASLSADGASPLADAHYVVPVTVDGQVHDLALDSTISGAAVAGDAALNCFKHAPTANKPNDKSTSRSLKCDTGANDKIHVAQYKSQRMAGVACAADIGLATKGSKAAGPPAAAAAFLSVGAADGAAFTCEGVAGASQTGVLGIAPSVAKYAEADAPDAADDATATDATAAPATAAAADTPAVKKEDKSAAAGSEKAVFEAIVHSIQSALGPGDKATLAADRSVAPSAVDAVKQQHKALADSAAAAAADGKKQDKKSKADGDADADAESTAAADSKDGKDGKKAKGVDATTYGIHTCGWDALVSDNNNNADAAVAGNGARAHGSLDIGGANPAHVKKRSKKSKKTAAAAAVANNDDDEVKKDAHDDGVTEGDFDFAPMVSAVRPHSAHCVASAAVFSRYLSSKLAVEIVDIAVGSQSLFYPGLIYNDNLPASVDDDKAKSSSDPAASGAGAMPAADSIPDWHQFSVGSGFGVGAGPVTPTVSPLASTKGADAAADSSSGAGAGGFMSGAGGFAAFSSKWMGGAAAMGGGMGAGMGTETSPAPVSVFAAALEALHAHCDAETPAVGVIDVAAPALSLPAPIHAAVIKALRKAVGDNFPSERVPSTFWGGESCNPFDKYGADAINWPTISVFVRGRTLSHKEQQQQQQADEAEEADDSEVDVETEDADDGDLQIVFAEGSAPVAATETGLAMLTSELDSIQIGRAHV